MYRETDRKNHTRCVNCFQNYLSGLSTSIRRLYHHCWGLSVGITLPALYMVWKPFASMVPSKGDGWHSNVFFPATLGAKAGMMLCLNPPPLFGGGVTWGYKVKSGLHKLCLIIILLIVAHYRGGKRLKEGLHRG